MKAQVALEYLIIASIVLGSAIILFYFAINYSSESISISQAKESIGTLSKAIDYVYALGPGSQTTVIIDVPQNIVDSYVVQNEIGFKIGVGGQIIDIYEVTKASVSGNLPTTYGRHVVILSSTDEGVVISAS